MATLIFDIETVGEQWNDFDELSKDSLTRWIKKTARSPEEYQVLLGDLQNGLGFSPLTGVVVSIAVYDLQRKMGAVYYVGETGESDMAYGDFSLKVRNEVEMLEDFWEGAKSYDTFVTFNGRQFDVPFLVHRSIIHKIKPTCDLCSGRYLYQQKEVKHVDLQDQLTFYGAMQRRPNLHMLCRAYGIKSPKSDEVSGDAVAELFRKKKFSQIARYNADDVVATTALYQRWLDYLAPTDFKY